MILYKNNSNLGIKTVTTVNGEKEYRRNCKLIKNEYHIMNKDCFEVNGQWYRTSSGFIVYDHEKEEWVLMKDSNLLEGIVGFEKNQPVTGYFSKNVYNNIRVNKYGFALNTEILLENGFIEDICKCIWYHRSELDESTLKKISSIRSGEDYKNKGYNIEDNAEEFKEKIEAYAKYPTIISKDAITYAKLLNNHTFGAEIELSRGCIPENLQYRTGIVMCRDGSISGKRFGTLINF